MVDAINAINSAIKTVVEQRKVVSIDWKGLSAKEVLEYAGKGEDIPLDVLKWAEDYAKLVNAPDDVTYDAANGSANNDDVVENASKSGQTKDSAETKRLAETEDNTDIDTNDTQNPDEVYNQGVTNIQENNISINDTNIASTQSETDVKSGEEAAINASQLAAKTVVNTQSQKAEYDNLLNKINSDGNNVDFSDLNKLNNLQMQIRGTNNQAQGQFNTYDEQIQQIESEFAKYLVVADDTMSVANSAIQTGETLEEKNPNLVSAPKIEQIETETTNTAMQNLKISQWQFIFDRNYVMGTSDIETGKENANIANNKIDEINNKSVDNKQSEATVDNARNVIKTTDVNNENIIETENKNNNDDNDNKIKKPEEKENELNKNSSKNKTDLNGVKDSTLLSDNLELQRRRELRGEQPPQA